MKIIVALFGLTGLVLLGGCNSSSASSAGNRSTPAVTSCLTGTGKQEVLDIMRDWYFWNDETEQADKYETGVGDFSDVGALLDYLRYRPSTFDRGFTFVTTPEEENAFFEEGTFVGFGFGMTRIGNTHDIRITQVYAGSPADMGGLERGFRLVAVDGRSIAQIDLNEGINEALGPAVTGEIHTLTVEDRAGNLLPDIQLTKAAVDLDPVAVVRILNDAGGDSVGYIFFRTFVTTAVDELRAAMLQFQQQMIRKVVIDLRYNGGGLVSVAEVLGSLLAGPGNVGVPFFFQEFNSDNMDFNQTSLFHSESASLDLDKIVFITTGGTASASELLINGLKPYFEDAGEAIAIVGSPSYGKPVGQSAFDFCGDTQRLRAITFKTVNVRGEGDYFNGLPVDCPANDDLQSLLGDDSEESLSVALNYLNDGTCNSMAIVQGLGGAGKAKATAMPVLSGPKIWHHYAGAF